MILAVSLRPACTATMPRTGFGEVVERFVIFPGTAFGGTLHASYPLIPWIGVTLLGVSQGFEFRTDPEAAHWRAGLLGCVFLVAFNLVRGFGGPFGNLRGWPRGDGDGVGGQPHVSSLIEWLSVCKYPPSLAFALLTVGANMVALRLFHALQSRVGGEWLERWLAPWLVFGRAPLFFYMLHFWLYCIVAMGMHAAGSEGVPLPWCLPFWFTALVLLFFVVRPYGAFKARQHPDSLWRLL